MIWLILGAVVLASLFYMTKPFYMKASDQSFKDERRAYKRQIAELDKLISRDTGDRPALQAAKADLQRRLLANDDAGLKSKPPAAGFIAGFFVLFGFAALGLYATLGTPELAKFGILSAERGGADNLSLEQLVVKLESQLQQEPQNPQGWVIYARSLMQLQRYDHALEAYEHALKLTDNNQDLAAELARAKAHIEEQE